MYHMICVFFPYFIWSLILNSIYYFQIKEVVSQNPDQIGKPLLKVRLSPKQWDNVNRINVILSEEYTTRREMLLKRIDVTIQSFMWSEKAKVQCSSHLLTTSIRWPPLYKDHHYTVHFHCFILWTLIRPIESLIALWRSESCLLMDKK